MSKFNKKSLVAVAVAAALAAPAAHAVKLTGEGDTAITPINSNQFGGPTPVFVKGSDLEVYLQKSDVALLQPNTTYNLRIQLPTTTAAPTFLAAVPTTVVTSLTGSGTNGGVVNINFTTNGTPAADIDAEVDDQLYLGTISGNVGTPASIGYSPSYAAQLADGATLTAAISASRPSDGATVLAGVNAPVIKSVQGVDVKFTPEANPNRVDVGVSDSDDRKIYFTSTPNVIGSGSAATSFVAGQVTISDAEGVDPWLAGVAGHVATVTVEGVNLSAFNEDGVATLGSVEGVLSDDGKSLVFEDVDFTPGAAMTLTLNGDGETVITATDLKVTAVVDPDGADLSNYATFAKAGDLAPIEYNGAVVTLYNVNPASNQTQESLLRYTNPTSIPLAVTLNGVDDAGVASSGEFSFTLPAYGSVSLRSIEIENGTGKANGRGALGAPTSGKWIITATAEGSELIGSGLNRSASTGVISELVGEKHAE